MIIIEENFQDLNVKLLKESGDNNDPKYFLEGVFGEVGIKNKNQRIYKSDEMDKQLVRINESASANRHVLGELDHPDTLEIKLKNVSHRILEMKRVGNKVMGKAEILKNHPNGQIAIGLIKDGIQLGVSTRGSGKVKNGIVENYNLVTVDLVATPSAHSAYPETIQEQLEMAKNGTIIKDLAEAVIYDPVAKKYFEIEMRKLVNELYRK